MPDLPPKGWYPDPCGQPARRYWNGTEWTYSLRRLPDVHTKLARLALVGAGIAFFLFVGLATETVDPNGDAPNPSSDTWAITLLVVFAVLIVVAVVEFVVGWRRQRSSATPSDPKAPDSRG